MLSCKSKLLTILAPRNQYEHFKFEISSRESKNRDRTVACGQGFNSLNLIKSFFATALIVLIDLYDIKKD